MTDAVTGMVPGSVSGGTFSDQQIAWSRELTAERYPLPLSPLGWSNLSAVFDRGVRAFGEFMGMPLSAKEQLATTINGWVVANPAAFDFKGKFKISLSRADQIEVGLAALRSFYDSPSPMQALKELVTWARHPEKAKTKLGERLDAPTVRFVGEAILRYLQPLARRLREEWPGTVSAFRSELTAVDAVLPAAKTARELLALGNRLQTAMIAYVEPDLVIYAIREIASLFLAELATLAGMPDPKRVPIHLGAGLEENITLATHRKFLELGRRLGAASWSGKSGTALLSSLGDGQRAALDGFLKEAGHLTASWDIQHPTWGEDPARFCELLAAASVSPGGTVRAAESASTGGDHHAIETEFARRLEGRPFALELMHTLTGHLRTFLVIDEEHHFHTGRIIPVTRRLVMRLGGLLAERGLVQRPDDLFWLTDGEVRQMLEDGVAEDGGGRVVSPSWTPAMARALVATRRQAWEQACREGCPVGEASRPGPQTSPDGKTMLRGSAASPGKARGPIRRVAGLADIDRVREGDVLLVRSPDPFYVVLYPRVAALVAETGALLSHGAIAARESCLPAVLGVKGAWRVFPDGTMVEVDGSAGEIRALG